MAARTWFMAVAGTQQGPFTEEKFREFIAGGQVTPDTLVWSDGMAGWQKAGDIPGLMASSPSPPPVPLPPGATAPASGAPQAIEADLDVWPLFGRALLLMLGFLLIVPAPWTATAYYRWLVSRLRVPQIGNLGFAGKPGDIWWVFVLTALSTYSRLLLRDDVLPLLLAIAEMVLSWLTLRWIFAKITSEARPLAFKFTGDLWLYIGWTLLAGISIITIIGWAWVVTAWTRWVCRNVEDSTYVISFNATGWEMLWRSFVFVLTIVLIIPIPWVLRWYLRWYFSQFSVADKTA